MDLLKKKKKSIFEFCGRFSCISDDIACHSCKKKKKKNSKRRKKEILPSQTAHFSYKYVLSFQEMRLTSQF